MRIGVVTDTHLPGTMRDLGDLGPEVAVFFSTVDMILHCGDVVSPIVLEWLEQFAPVLVAEGNNDNFKDSRAKPVQVEEFLGWRIGMVHNMVREDRPRAVIEEAHFKTPVDVMLAGHTHVDRLELKDGAVLLNSGSPILPHHKDARLGTVGLLELSTTRLRAAIVRLGETPGKPNPGRARTALIER
jgi:putative phosphoesterase